MLILMQFNNHKHRQHEAYAVVQFNTPTIHALFDYSVPPYPKLFYYYILFRNQISSSYRLYYAGLVSGYYITQVELRLKMECSSQYPNTCPNRVRGILVI